MRSSRDSAQLLATLVGLQLACASTALAREVSFSWEELEGAKAYELRVLKGNATFLTKTIDDTDFKTDLAPGQYRFQVRGYDKYKRAGEWSEYQELTVPLASPKLRGPASDEEITLQKDVPLKWDSVEGAEGYEVTLTLKVPGPGVKNVKANTQKVKRFPASVTEWRVPWVPAGAYVWKVRAIASVAPSQPVAETTAEFNVAPRNPYVGASGFVALSGLLSPYQYKSERQVGTYQPSYSATSSIVRVSGEYWLSKSFALGGDIDHAFLKLDDKSFGLNTTYLVGKTRKALDDASSWYFAAEAGIERRQFLELVVDSKVLTDNPEFHGDVVTSIGPHLGVEIRKQLTKSLTLSNKLLAFIPMTFSASEISGKVQSEPSLHNISLGSQIAYWAAPQVGLAFGAFIDRRSIQYLKESNSSVNKIEMNAIYAFGSFILLIP